MSKSEVSTPLRRHRLSVAIAMLPVSFLAIGSASALGQDQADAPAQLPGINVTADWLGPPTEESEKTYTGARTVVEEEELQATGALNLDDALRPVPGLTVLDETGTGILPNIGVRGLNPLRSERCEACEFARAPN